MAAVCDCRAGKIWGKRRSPSTATANHVSGNQF